VALTMDYAFSSELELKEYLLMSIQKKSFNQGFRKKWNEEKWRNKRISSDVAEM
jgi:hypothetical protein